MLKPHCRDKETKALMQDAHSMIALMMKRIEEMSLHLRPSQLDAFGLYVTLHSQCTEQSDAAGWVLHFDAPKAGHRPRPDVETTCFRLAQQALANIAKHAKATEVWVSLIANGDELRLLVRDNGRGFNVAEIQNGPERDNLGLIGMAERARQVGGRVDFESRPGGGTEVRAVFPQLASSG